MIKKFLLLASFLVFSPCFSQNDSAFQDGEYLKFRVRYGVFNSSYASLLLKNKVYEGKTVYHALGKGETTGLAKLFFKVDDTYESYFDKNTGKPYFFNRDIYEGGYTKKLNFFFNFDTNNLRIKNLENNEEKNMPIQPDIKDVISTLYYLRNNPKMNSLNKNDEVSMDMIFDDDEVYKFKLKLLGREKVKTHFGTVNTLKFCPLVQDGRVFKEEESITMWITDDKNKVPVKLRAAFRVGSLVAELDGFNNLKNETDLKKN